MSKMKPLTAQKHIHECIHKARNNKMYAGTVEQKTQKF